MYSAEPRSSQWPSIRMDGAREVAQDRLQRVRVPRQHGAGVLADVALVVIEEGVLHLVEQPLAAGSSWAAAAVAAVAAAARSRSRSPCANRVPPGPLAVSVYVVVSLGVHLARSARLHGADALIDRNVRRVRCFPTQRGRLAPLDGRRLGHELTRSPAWRRWRRRWLPTFGGGGGGGGGTFFLHPGGKEQRES